MLKDSSATDLLPRDSHEEARQQILLVDDNPQNLKVLYETLLVTGHKLRVASSGIKALEIIQNAPVDLILLDIMMPDMNGFEVCQKLRENPALRDIPVIFLSAVNDVDAKVRGFDAGAVDYITKPFQAREVIARVTTHLRLRHLEWQQALVEARKKIDEQREQLEQRSRLATLGEMATGLAHEINQPLTAILNYASVALKAAQGVPMNAALLVQSLEKLVLQTQRAANVVQHMRSLARPAVSERVMIDVQAFIKETLLLAEVDIQRLHGAVSTEVDPALSSFYSDPKRLQQVLLNLLRNALEANLAAKQPAPVVLKVIRQGGYLQLRIEDLAAGLLPEIETRLFSPFNTSKKDGMGVGLSLCQNLIQGLGGRLSYHPNQPSGCCFVIELPLV